MKGYKIVFILIVFAACQLVRTATPEELQAKLNQTMQEYLYKQINNDSTNTKYHVLSGYNYAETDFYNCQFTVNVKHYQHDTTGIMTANISKDFATVTRKQ